MNEILKKLFSMAEDLSYLKNVSMESSYIRALLPLVQEGKEVPFFAMRLSDELVCCATFDKNAKKNLPLFFRLIAYINYYNIDGCIDVNEESGEIRYKLNANIQDIDRYIAKGNEKDAMGVFIAMTVFVSRYNKLFKVIENESQIVSLVEQYLYRPFEEMIKES